MKESVFLKLLRSFLFKLLKVDIVYNYLKEEMEKYRLEMQALKNENTLLKSKIEQKIIEQQTTINSVKNDVEFIRSMTRVAADVHTREPGWAVVCLPGINSDFVNFYSLPFESLQMVQSFLKQFKPTHPEQILLDTPPHIGRNEFFPRSR